MNIHGHEVTEPRPIPGPEEPPMSLVGWWMVECSCGMFATVGTAPAHLRIEGLLHQYNVILSYGNGNGEGAAGQGEEILEMVHDAEKRAGDA